MHDARAIFAFATISLIWGSTWVAAKIGIAEVPPVFFTGSRYVVSGVILAAWLFWRGESLAPPTGLGKRVVISAFFTMVLSPGLMFWGLARTPSALAAVMNLSLIPVSLYAIGLIAREETVRARLNLALALGIGGLVLLFLPRITGQGAAGEMVGFIAVVVGTVSYALGAVIGRPATHRYATIPMSAVTCLGGGALVVISLLFEPHSAATFQALFTPTIFASWLILTVAGSLIAFPIYLWLLRVWGPVRSGLYAFVSPIIATILGAMILGERFGIVEIAGMVTMLFGTWIALRRPQPEKT
jgi:drug/metabolite transporter (DMT)-like permease